MTITNARARELLHRFTKRAGARLRDPDSVEALLTAAGNQVQNVPHEPAWVTQARGHIAIMIRMVRAYIDGRYRRLPWRALAAIVGGLVYFVTPVDAIPDFLAMFGFADDLAVLLFVAGQVREEMERFLLWEAARVPERKAADVLRPKSEI